MLVGRIGDLHSPPDRGDLRGVLDPAKPVDVAEGNELRGRQFVPQAADLRVRDVLGLESDRAHRSALHRGRERTQGIAAASDHRALRRLIAGLLLVAEIHRQEGLREGDERQPGRAGEPGHISAVFGLDEQQCLDVGAGQELPGGSQVILLSGDRHNRQRLTGRGEARTAPRAAPGG